MGKDKKEISKGKAVLGSALRIGKKTLRAALISGVILGAVGSFCNIWAQWVYRVKENYGAVITEWDGERVAVTEPGWKMRTPFLSTYENGREEYPLANQTLFLHGKTKPHEVITKDGVVIMAAATTFYEITDLHQYAIENVKADTTTIELSERTLRTNKIVTMSPRDMVQRTLDSIIGDYIQKTKPEELIHNRSVVEEEVLKALKGNQDFSKRYGIQINDFRFTETTYIKEVVEANAKRQAAVAEAEGEYAAMKIKLKTIEKGGEAEAANYKKIEKAFNPQTQKERERFQMIFKDLVLYRTLKERKGGTVWMFGNEPPKPVFNPGQ